MPTTDLPGAVSSRHGSATNGVNALHHSSPGLEFVTSKALNQPAEQWLASRDAYSLALDYIQGHFDVHGDLVEAVRYALRQASQTWRGKLLDTLVCYTPRELLHILTGATSRASAARNIRFHYDRSNDFYRIFLDSRMVYSCAYYRNPDDSLDQAQVAKLDLICRKLRLSSGERFLDIGCGWGALLLRATRQYGARGFGCTLSHRQVEFVESRIQEERLAGQIKVREMDYRDVGAGNLGGQFDKIASVGMFEHVGRVQLETYFRKVYTLLTPGGLFLNHGITRPAPVHGDGGSMFIARKVFPGGQILRLEDVTGAAERAGFEVLDVENLRPHYALTCREWVRRLIENGAQCLRVVDAETWRTWKLYLAGSAMAFEDGDLGLHQVLLAKRGSAQPMTRDSIYAQ